MVPYYDVVFISFFIDEGREHIEASKSHKYRRKLYVQRRQQGPQPVLLTFVLSVQYMVQHFT